MSVALSGASQAAPGPKIFGVARNIAILIISTLVLASLSLTLLFMFLGSQSVSDRNTRILRVVTAPDAKVDKLVSPSGLPGEGKIYYREGTPTMLVVLSSLPPEPDSLHYVLWSMQKGQALSFDVPRFDKQGTARITLEAIDPGGVDQVLLNLENYDARVPTGKTVLSWKRG